MRTIEILLAFLVLIGVNASAQMNIREYIRFKDTVKVDKFKLDPNGFSCLKLKMNPGEHEILNLNELKKLTSQTVVGVDLVYSDYPHNADFTELNRLRILELLQFLPSAFNSQIVKWQLIKQTGVKNSSAMPNYFHGFVIYYRPMPSFKEENDYIMSIVDGKTPPSDSTLLKVFKRNPNWKSMTVVCDVTGSMSPYTGQLLLWIKSNQKMNTFKQIVFFNDDDERSTDQLKKEDPSGMWAIETTNSNKVIDLAFKAMTEGDHIENDLEAICYAIKKYPENKENIVLIADNWEDPCDMQLLEFLKKEKVPVKIIICGVEDRLNTLYLELAHATGGSIHTMEEDLKDIAKIGEGKRFKIGKMKFYMAGGKFIQE
ncbi:MAG: hypothetical protein ACK5FX_00570 [Flavobacteriia bacterium]|jgi:hypothetical protein